MVLDSLFQVLKLDVSVDLGRVEVTVAKQLLHVPDAGAATQEMSHAAMAKGVHRGFEFNLPGVVGMRSAII